MPCCHVIFGLLLSWCAIFAHLLAILSQCGILLLMREFGVTSLEPSYLDYNEVWFWYPRRTNKLLRLQWSVCQDDGRFKLFSIGNVRSALIVPATYKLYQFDSLAERESMNEILRVI